MLTWRTFVIPKWSKHSVCLWVLNQLWCWRKSWILFILGGTCRLVSLRGDCQPSAKIDYHGGLLSSDKTMSLELAHYQLFEVHYTDFPKKMWWLKFGPNGPKMAQIEGFSHYLQIASLDFANFAYWIRN